MMAVDTTLAEYDGVACETLRVRCGATGLVIRDHCASTMDLAHELAAAGAPHGTVVVAESQAAGRGRTGKTWTSTRGAGVWVSVLLRDPLAAPTGVLSLRVGLGLARALDAYVATPVQLKWPNDLFLHGAKLGGILIEARWRGDVAEWIVVGVGVNVREDLTEPGVAALGGSASCATVLSDVVQAVLQAASPRGELGDGEVDEFAVRDLARGREIVEPLAGIVVGITSSGGLQVRTPRGEAVAVAGSLVFRTLPPE